MWKTNLYYLKRNITQYSILDSFNFAKYLNIEDNLKKYNYIKSKFILINLIIILLF